MRISKKKKHFEKGYEPNWSEELFKVKIIQETNPLTYRVEDMNGEEIQGSFYSKELQKSSQSMFRIKKVIKKDLKSKKSLVKWRGYASKFNSWVFLKDIEKLTTK